MDDQTSFVLSSLRYDPYSRVADADRPFLSSSFCKGLAALYYCLEYGTSILMLTAEPGLGKTTLLRHFQRRWQERGHTLFVSPCPDNGSNLLYRLLNELRETCSSNDLRALRMQIDAILTRVAEPDNPFIMFLDYDPNTEHSAVNCLQHLASLESFANRLLRVVIAGSPDLGETLRASEFADGIQDVPLSPMAAAEVEGYINYRLLQAGWNGGRLFTGEALILIAERSSGKPSALNEICFKILQDAAYSGILSRLVGPTERESRWADNEATKENRILDEDYDGFPISLKTMQNAGNYRVSSRAWTASISRWISSIPPAPCSVPSRMVLLTSITVLVLVFASAGFWYGSAVWARTIKHVTAQITAAFTTPGRPSRIYAKPSNRLPNRPHGVAARAGKSLASNAALGPSSEQTRQETQRLSSLASAPISGTPTTRKSASGDSAHLTSGVVSVPLSSPTTSLLSDAIAPRTQAVGQADEKKVNKTSQTLVHRLSHNSAPVAQPTTKLNTPPGHKIAVSATRTRTTRTEMAAHQIKLGDVYMDVGEYDRAVRSFLRAIVLAPGNKAAAEEKIRQAHRAKTTEESILK